MSDEGVAALAVSCFRDQPRPAFRCSVNGRPVSAFEYLICRFEQAANGGSAERDRAGDARAKAGAASLSSVLTAMLDDIQATPLGSVGEVSARWGDRLLQFNSKGFSAYQFVVQSLGECFQRAANQSTGTDP